jgi:predicted nucleic acid-binding protein
VIVLDTSGLLAAIDESQRQHAACARALSKARPPLILSPFVLAELDYLLTAEVGLEAEAALLEEVARGAYRLEPFDGPAVATAVEIISRYRDLAIGLADASIVVLANRYGTRDILTLDDRHFRALRTIDRKKFRLLPADA